MEARSKPTLSDNNGPIGSKTANYRLRGVSGLDLSPHVTAAITTIVFALILHGGAGSND